MRYAIENGNEVLYIDNLGFDGNASDPQNGQISITGEYLGMRTRKGAADGEYVIAELFFDVDLQDPNKSRSTQFRMVNRTRYSMESGQSLEGTSGYEFSLPDTGWFVVENGMDLNGEFTTELQIPLNGQGFEPGTVYGLLSKNAEGLISEGAGVITLTSQDPTQFINSQNGTYDGEIDQYEEAGGFILDRNLS